jgi:hypothetical protein
MNQSEAGGDAAAHAGAMKSRGESGEEERQREAHMTFE